MNGATLARQVQDRIALRVRIGSVEGSHTFCVATGCFVACCFCCSFPRHASVSNWENWVVTMKVQSYWLYKMFNMFESSTEKCARQQTS